MFDFDTPVNRRGTNCVKWDKCLNSEELPLWVADMDFRTSPAIIEALRKRVEHGIFGYSCPGDDYYEATIKWFERRHNWKIKRESIVYTTGVVPAISATIKALTKPGDGVVIMTPVYTCFFSSIRNNECMAVESPLRMVNRRYEIDFENLDEKLSRDTSKVLLLCNPHNPGGRVWTRVELEKVAELCGRHNVIVISDEIHCEITMPGFKYTPFGTLNHHNDLKSVSFISPSKSFNTAGLHTANIVCEDSQMRAQIDRAININETCDIGPFGIEALIAAYRHGEPWLNAMIDYVHNNYEMLFQKLDGLHGMKVMKLEGSYLAWIDVTTLGVDVETLCNRLRHEANVWFHPGTSYGTDGEGYIRINMATARVTLTEALNRYIDWLNQNFEK